MHNFFTVIFVFLSCLGICQKTFRDINPYPFDSSIVSIQKVQSSDDVNDFLKSIPVDKAELLFVGEYHKWKENTAFYKSVLQRISNPNQVVCFELSVIYQRTLDNYLKTGDSLRFRKNMLYLNSNIDRALFENRIAFFIGLKELPQNKKFKFYAIDQYASAVEYLKSLHLILSSYKADKSINPFDKKLVKSIKTLNEAKGVSKQDSSIYSAVSDTVELYKHLKDEDRKYYNDIIYAFSKSQKKAKTLFGLEIIREKFLVEKVLEKSDSLRLKTVLFCGQSHASYTKYVDNFSSNPSVPYIGQYFKNKYPEKTILNICFDVINKIDTGVKLSSLAKMASYSQDFTNRFWQALTVKDSLNEFTLYTCKAPKVPFDYIILKKNGTNMFDSESYLNPKK